MKYAVEQTDEIDRFLANYRDIMFQTMSYKVQNYENKYWFISIEENK